MRRAWGLLPLLALSAIGADAQTHINVSRIVTGTQTAVDWSEITARATRFGVKLSDYAMATGQADPQLYFSLTPWGSAPTSDPARPVIDRTAPLADYVQGGTTFAWDRHYTSAAEVDMTPAGAKPVTASVFKAGAAVATISYRVQAVQTDAQPLDYFIGLDPPVPLTGFQPAYNLCCSGDSNGGTYNYLEPHDAKARAAIDVYVDDLPVWSSEDAFVYPLPTNDPQAPPLTPFSKAGITWNQPAASGKTYLYLGRLTGGQGFVVTLVARVESAGSGDCGSQSESFSSPPTVARHCLDLFAKAPLAGGAGASPPGFYLFWKAPKP